MVVLVFNYGGQYAHLIARRVRELGVHSEIVPPAITSAEVARLSPRAIILSGGPASVYEAGAPQIDNAILSLGIPVLGICYGHQLLAHALGGSVAGGGKKEFGKVELTFEKSLLFEGIASPQPVWFSHGDEVKAMPAGFHKLAATATCANAAMADDGRRIYGVQFHPEVVHTPCGMVVLSNFLFGISRCTKDWNANTEAERIVAQLRRRIGGSKVLMGISGGVDSLVAALLLHKAVGKNLHCVLVDHGLMRKDEVGEVVGYLRTMGFAHLHVVDASKEFLGGLDGVSDPEAKRKVIGHAFIRVFEAKARQLEGEGIKFLGQGTIYPDRIESAQPSKHASKIKSHHNLTLPDDMKLEVVEPLAEFYKDEVRVIGKHLGIPAGLLGRHPFPGPGLAIRVLGEVTSEKLAILREADAIYTDELRAAGWYDKIWQAFAALLPVRSVGVMGDSRTYDYIIALRAVNSVDGMTADWSKLPPDVLERISSRIVNEVKGVNRVLYDVTQKPPGTIEYE